MTSRDSDTVTSIFKCNSSNTIKSECRFYTAGCGNKMAVSVTGLRAVNELGGPVIPGTVYLLPSMILSLAPNTQYSFHTGRSALGAHPSVANPWCPLVNLWESVSTYL